MKKLLLLFIFFSLYCIISQAQTRGALPGEIYISTDTYIGIDGLHYAVFYSSDNGKTLSLQYENVEGQSGVMLVGDVLGDATPGAVYNNYLIETNELWVSFDYGVNWEYRGNYPDNTYYLCGIDNGVIFNTSWVKLNKSDDYGQNFEIITDPLTIPIPEIGFFDGEFFGINGDAGVGFELIHTIDNTNTYTEIPIDSSVAFWEISGRYPQISRGTEPGELYLVSWWPDYHYKIFYSIDTGYSWTRKFESGGIGLDWSLRYSAGRQPGSFYVFRSTLDLTLNHRLYYIDYSDDYGVTFTTYFHELDSLFTSVVSIYKTDFKLSASPNPFSGKTTLAFELSENWKAPILNIYNIHGILIRQFDITGKKSQQWDGRDSKGNNVPAGIYLYNISYNNTPSQYKKVLFIH
ncbi:MAG: T9SS type A sorting domain-containing protein [Bacteroidetes bacterium]|nr:T9SS type A sorting domain-containing protein [Bacteroidota bacterium]